MTPLLVVAAVIGQRTYASLEEQSLVLQQEVATDVGHRLRTAVVGRESELRLLDDLVGLGALSPEGQRSALSNLLASQRLYQRLALLDAGGQELVRVSRDDAVANSELQNRAGEEAFRVAVAGRATYVGPVEFDPVLREPLTTIAVPLPDRRTGDVGLVLIATVRFKPIWDLLADLDLEEGRQVYVVDDTGRIVAHANPAVVLRGSQMALPESDGQGTGLSGKRAVLATDRLALGEGHLMVVAEQPLSNALDVANRALRVTALVSVIALLVAIALALGASRQVVKPIEALATAARRIAAGDLSHRAPEATTGEIGDLASAFNQMTVELSEMIDNLEDLVSARTSELEDAAATQRSLIAELETQNVALEGARRQLEELIRSKDEFLGSVSHELRTPLTAVVGFASELRDQYAEFDESDRLALVTLIAQQAQEMADIINDLLVAARSDTAELAVTPSKVDVGANVLTVLEPMSDVAVKVRLPDEPATAVADPTRLRQIMRNLVVNSIRYGGSDVEVRVADSNGRVIIQVTDDGHGIPEDEWELVFDPYHRAHNAKSQPASVGLGLTVSRMLARRMDGDLTYRYDDGRSVFELVLPADG